MRGGEPLWHARVAHTSLSGWPRMAIVERVSLPCVNSTAMVPVRPTADAPLSLAPPVVSASVCDASRGRAAVRVSPKTCFAAAHAVPHLPFFPDFLHDRRRSGPAGELRTSGSQLRGRQIAGSRGDESADEHG